MPVWKARDLARLIPLILSPLVGCGDGTASRRDAETPLDAFVARPDGGSDSGPTEEGGLTPAPPAATISPMAPELPSAPMPPLMTTCRDGWVIAETGDYCEPAWPVGASCADDEALFVGETGCTKIGVACGADGWPTGLPAAGDVLFVRAGASPGGDGTRARPYAVIADALGAATEGAVVALAAGRYTEELVLPAGVTLWGACVASTTIVGDDPGGSDLTIGVTGPGARVRNLRLEGARIEVRGPTASAEVTDVLLDRVDGWALRAVGAQVVLRGVVARDGGEGADGPWNQIYGDEGAQMVLERVAVERAIRGIGIFEPGSAMELRDVVVRDCAGDFATGMNFGATLVAEGLVVDRANEWSFMVSGEASSAVLSDVLVRDSGHSLVANFGARLDVERVATIRGVEGLRTDLAGSRLVATDVIVRDTTSFGLTASTEASITVTRAKLVNVGRQGLFVRSSATASATDLDVDGAALSGVDLNAGASATITRARVSNATFVGVRVEGAATSIELDGVSIVAPRPDEGGFGGIGIRVSAAASSATDLAVFDASEAAVQLTGAGARLDARDLTVERTSASPTAPDSGRAIELRDGAAIVLRRARLDASSAEALWVSGGARATVPDLSIDGAAGEAAIRVTEDGALIAERVRVAHAAATALAVGGADVTLTDLDVRDALGDGLVVESRGAISGLARTALDGVDGVALRLDPGGRIGAEVTDVSIARLGRIGLMLDHGLPLTLRRIGVTGSAGGVAILVRERGTIVTASDVRLAGEETATIARGIEVARGSRWSSVTTTIERASDVGVLVSGGATDAVLRDLALDECAIGASVLEMGALELEAFVARGSSVAAIQLGVGSSLDLRRGSVRDNVIGANVQDPSFDVRRLTIDAVVFADNGTDVSLEALPLPVATP